MSDDALLKNRIKDLAERSFQNNRYCYTNFLSLNEQSLFHEIEREVSYSKPYLFGGNEWCERKVLRFGDSNELMYEEPFPITALLIEPLNSKFSDDLTHRDFLGALMNLGIERETLGDIFVDEKQCILYCLDSISQYIIDELTRVKHTSVKIKRFRGEFKIPESLTKEALIQVSSERIDGVVARVCKLSREDSLELFKEQKVFINGRLITGNDTKVKANDIVSVRGFGRFTVLETVGLSKKGKLNIKVQIYI